MTPHTPSSTLFPYTTLFRSRQARRWPPQPLSGPGALPAAGSAGPETGHRRSPGRLDQRGRGGKLTAGESRSEEHTSELQSHVNLVCRLLLEKKNDLKRIERM